MGSGKPLAARPARGVPRRKHVLTLAVISGRLVPGVGEVLPVAAPTDFSAVKTETREQAAPSNDSMSGMIARELPKLKRLAWMLVRDDDHANDLVQNTVVRTYAHS